MTDLEVTRAILAEAASWHDARSAALDATGLSSFHDRWVWLGQHPITQWMPPSSLTALQILDHELDIARAEGFRAHFDSRSVPRPKRKYKRHKFTEIELRIAAEVEARRTA